MKANKLLILGLAGVLGFLYIIGKPSSSEELARLMYAEGANQPKAARVLIGETVMNRTRIAGYPSNIDEVIHQPGQFSSVSGRLWRQTALAAWTGYEGNMNPTEKKVFEECEKDAARLTEGGRPGIPGEKRIEAFYSGEKPSGKYWDNMRTVYSSGNMKFCARRR